VAGSLRFFADRFGVPRAGIEGTTLSYDLVREYATLGSPRVVLVGGRKHQRLAIERRRSYFGFELDTEVEPLDDAVPEHLLLAARDLLADAIVAGETTHPDQGRVGRSLADLDELWRRSGGTLPALAPVALRARIRTQLEPVNSWQDFLATRLSIDPDGLAPPEVRARLEALPRMVQLRGDAAPLDYEVMDGQGVVRVRLREGQAKRLRPDELPQLDRPLRFAVQRGRQPPLLADTLPAMQALLRRAPKAPRDDDEGGGRRGRHRGRSRHRPGRRR
jgi:hypothetical protein